MTQRMRMKTTIANVMRKTAKSAIVTMTMKTTMRMRKIGQNVA